MKMVENTIVIKNEEGLHARPAAKIVELVNKYKSNAWLCYKDKKVNLKSILSVMTVSIEKGNEVKFAAEGEDEEILLEQIIKLINSDFKIEELA
jgi:phosphocarrier protein